MKTCEKCGKELKSSNDKHSIPSRLCGVCWLKWNNFFHENYNKLEEKYPYIIYNIPNPTYQVFVGKLKEQKAFMFR